MNDFGTRIDYALCAVLQVAGTTDPDGVEDGTWNGITGLHFALALAIEAPEAFEAYRAEWEEQAPHDYAAFAAAAAWVAERHDRSGWIGAVLSAAYASGALMRD